MKLHHSIFLVSCSILIFSSCSVSKKISKQANAILINDSAIRSGHIGISIYEPATGKFWYNFNSDKYFIPASNTKLFTLYAGMKYLGDSLAGMNVTEYENRIFLNPTGDPTFLHPDFPSQPVYDFLTSTTRQLWGLENDRVAFKAYGSGWAWDDYNDSYMNERSLMPVFGNNIVFSGTRENFTYFPKKAVNLFDFETYSIKGTSGYIDKVKRDFFNNNFTLSIDGLKKEKIVVPFITSFELSFKLLSDTLHKNIIPPNAAPPFEKGKPTAYYKIYSRPSDSLFKPMMHNSDNFFAEQTLLMVSNEKIGYMSDRDIIDSLLQKDLKDILQKPRWVDGSGLSRYNLFTPFSFIYILNKMKNEFGLDRLKMILPTGGEGSLKNYFIKDSSNIFAKTGTIGNNAALSGFLITNKGKLLIFSVLVNNYPGGSTPVRRAVEHFINGIREKN